MGKVVGRQERARVVFDTEQAASLDEVVSEPAVAVLVPSAYAKLVMARGAEYFWSGVYSPERRGRQKAVELWYTLPMQPSPQLGPPPLRLSPRLR